MTNTNDIVVETTTISVDWVEYYVIDPDGEIAEFIWGFDDEVEIPSPISFPLYTSAEYKSMHVCS